MGKVSSSDTKELISSPTVFNIFGNDGSGHIKENLTSSAGHTELEEIVNMINYINMINQDLKRFDRQDYKAQTTRWNSTETDV